MKLAVISMIRNEADIIGSFLQHLDALFDYAILMDHRSIDGTTNFLAEICASRSGWVLWHLEPVGYHQALFTAFAIRHAMEYTDADFLFFMDADEFIDAPDRATLEKSLAPLTNPDRVGHLYRRNLVPAQLDARAFQLDETVWRPRDRSPLGKVVMPRVYYDRHRNEVHLMSGNHGLYYPPDDWVPFDPVGEMLHLPVRSHSQIKNKLVAGVFANIANAARKAEQSRHWFELMNRIAEATLRDEDLIGLVARYGEADNTIVPIQSDELANRGFVPWQMTVARGRALPSPPEPDWIDPVRLIASILRDFKVEDAGGGELMLEGDRVRLVSRTG